MLSSLVLSSFFLLSCGMRTSINGLPSNPKNNLSDTDLMRKLLQEYNKYLIPHYETDEPIDIEVGMYIKAFSEFSESNMEYSISMLFRQEWTDERLRFDMWKNQSIFKGVEDLDVHPNFLENIWQPDPTFTDFKEGKTQRLLAPSKMLRIHSNGTVWYSTLMTLVLSCHMDLTTYPMDIQKCYLEFQSFGYRTKNIRYKWKNPNPLDVNEEIKIPQFYLEEKEICPVHCVRQYRTGNYSCLRVTFYFHREFGYHLLQTFLPSVLLVSLSWVSFWINPDATPARVTVGITCVLTLTTQSTGTRKDLPAVSYIKAIDVWMTTCSTFVFAALLEFALVNTFREYEKKEKKRPPAEIESTPSLHHDEKWEGEYGEMSLPSPDKAHRKSRKGFDKDAQCFSNKKRKARHIDHFSKAIFPLTFILFNLVYWFYYIALKFDSVDECEGKLDPSNTVFYDGYTN